MSNRREGTVVSNQLSAQASAPEVLISDNSIQSYKKTYIFVIHQLP